MVAPRPVPQLLLDRARVAPTATICVVHNSADIGMRGGKPVPDHPDWRAMDTLCVVAQVAGLADQLEKAGVRRGEAVAVWADTSHTWAAIDLALLSLGAVTVGIYSSTAPAQMAQMVAHVGARWLLVDHADRHAQAQGARLPADVHVLCWTTQPETLGGQWGDPERLAARVSALDPSATATFAWTAGTTAPPRAAVLSHAAIDQAVRASSGTFPTRPGDRSLVFLPMANALQRFATYRGLWDGVEGWYAPSMAALPSTFLAARPHVLLSVPAVLDRITSEARQNAEQRGAASLYDWAVDVVAHGRRPRASWSERARARLADHLVIRRIRAGLGGHLRVIVSGGARLSPETADWFASVGIPIRQSWGMTETCAPLTLETEGAARRGSVGKPLPHTQVRVEEDGALLVRSPTLFSGYWNAPAATAAAWTTDGWFRTGDVGQIDKDGYIFLRGRTHTRLVDTIGNTIQPEAIENALTIQGVGHVVVTNRHTRPLFAMCFVDPDHPVPSARLQRAIADAVARHNRAASPSTRIEAWEVIAEPLSVADGTLTPSLGVCLPAVIAREAARLLPAPLPPAH